MTGHGLLEALFLFSLAMVLYAYFGYPASLCVLGVVKKHRREPRQECDFRATVIITAFNEEGRIERKLENTLSVKYPHDRIQVIVASDGSTDGTNTLLKKYEEKGVRVLFGVERKGKENAQREALKYATGEIVVFTDVATLLEEDAIARIVSNFADPSVGCVSSEDRVMARDGKVSGENIYVRYEMWLRHLESKVSSPVGLSGSFFAARRSACDDFSSDMDSDFRVLLNCVRRGMRGTCDEKAIGYYVDLSDRRKEFDRKVRTVLRGLTLFFRNLEFLNVFRYGLFSYQLFCHKLLRWLVPFFLILLLAVNVPLASVSRGYAILLATQGAFYGVAALSLFRDLYSSRMILLKIPVYFVTVNASILVAWLRYLAGHRVLVWTPSER